MPTSGSSACAAVEHRKNSAPTAAPFLVKNRIHVPLLSIRSKIKRRLAGDASPIRRLCPQLGVPGLHLWNWNGSPLTRAGIAPGLQSLAYYLLRCNSPLKDKGHFLPRCTISMQQGDESGRFCIEVDLVRQFSDCDEI